MKILKRIGQLFSVATIAIGIATCFFPPLWPITVSFAGIALLFWGAYGLVSYFRPNIKPPVQNPIPSPPLRPIQPSDKEIRLKELRKHINELKEEDKKQDVQIAHLKSKNKLLREEFAAVESKSQSLEERLSALEKKLKPTRRHSFSTISLPKFFKPARHFSSDDAFYKVAKADNSSPAKSLSGNLAHKLPPLRIKNRDTSPSKTDTNEVMTQPHAVGNQLEIKR